MDAAPQDAIDLRTLYAKNWGDAAGVRLVDVALSRDTEATGAKSVVHFLAAHARAG